MKRPRVVGLGLCVVDHSYGVDDLALAATRTRLRERRVGSGGMVATALLQAAALGCDAHLLSVIGADAEGRFLRRSLRAGGVVTRRLLSSERVPTTLAVVLVDRGNGERRFLVPDRRGIEARAPELELSAIRKGSVLLVDGHFPKQAQRAVERARAVGATVIGDFHRSSAAIRRLLPLVHHPVVSREFLETSGERDARRALRALAQRCDGNPVVTLGERGGIYLEGGRLRRYAAHRVRVVDTTGAGDAFHGALAAGLAQGLPFAAAIELASRAGALACTALGGSGRLMTRGEMRRWRPRASRSATRGR